MIAQQIIIKDFTTNGSLISFNEQGKSEAIFNQ